MAASKIAPTLVYAHKPSTPREIATNTDSAIRSYLAADAWRELRALLRVARAAERADILHFGPHAAGTKPRTCAGCALMAGLGELSRASGARSRKGARRG